MALLASGSVGGPSSARLPDGAEGYSGNCNGMFDDWAQCYNAAADMCDGGRYQILSQNTSAMDDIPGVTGSSRVSRPPLPRRT